MAATITNNSVLTKYTDKALINIFSSPRSEVAINKIIATNSYDNEKVAFWSLYHKKFEVFKTLEKQPKIDKIAKDVLHLAEETKPENIDEIKKFIKENILEEKLTFDFDEEDIESQTNALIKTKNNRFNSAEVQKAIDSLFSTVTKGKSAPHEEEFTPIVQNKKPEIRENSELVLFVTNIKLKLSKKEELAAYFESNFKDRNLKKAISNIISDTSLAINDKKIIFEALASKKHSKKIFEEFELLNFYRVFFETTHHDVSIAILDNFSEVRSLDQSLKTVEGSSAFNDKYGVLGNLIIREDGSDKSKRIFRAVLKVYFNEICNSLTSENTISLLHLAFSSNKAWVFKKLNLFPNDHIREAFHQRIFHNVDQTSLNAELKKVLAEVLPLLERQYEVK